MLLVFIKKGLELACCELISIWSERGLSEECPPYLSEMQILQSEVNMQGIVQCGKNWCQVEYASFSSSLMPTPLSFSLRLLSKTGIDKVV